MKRLLVLVAFGFGILATTGARAQTVLPRASWIANASSSNGGDVPSNVLDGSSTSRWTTGGDQTPGQWFTVDFGTAQTFSQVTMDVGSSSSDYARSYELYVSNDGQTWGAPIANGIGAAGTITIAFPAQTARFIGIVQTSTTGNWWSIAELNVYSGTVPTVALTPSGWTATASVAGSSTPASNAIDGSSSTRFSTGTNQVNGQWLKVDLGSSQLLAAVKMDSGTSTTDYARGYQIYVSSDGSSWGSPVGSGTATTSPITAYFAQVSARYVKVVQTGTASNWWSIAELTLYTPSSLTPTASVLPRNGWTASASASSGADVPANTLDDSASTRWTTGANQANGQYFKLDMQTTWSLTKITLDAGASSSDYPRAYQVFVSTDGTNWGSAVATGTGSGALTTVTFPVQVARYIKVVQTGSSSSNWWSIAEVNVYGTAPALLLRDNWTATSSLNSSNAQQGIDGKIETEWSTGTAQVNGQWLKIDMKAAQTFNEITLDVTCNPADYARGYQVFVSSDGTNWGSAVASGTGMSSMITVAFATKTARYLKVVQTASASNYWGVAELNVINTNPLLCSAQCVALDACHDVGTCNPSTGVCSNPPKSGTSCSDGNACNGAEMCNNGVCQAGTPLATDDGNPCTVDSCDAVAGVQHVAGNAGTVCRASAGDCDVAETCTGTSAACPAEAFAASTTVCRASAGACDVAETCTGSSAACPADTLAAAGTTCRGSAGACDVAEVCSGSSAACPADGLAAVGTTCRVSAGICDVAEVCSGTSAACPADGLVAAGTTCRASAGLCDVAESCTGASAACPADGLVAAGTTCRPSGGACDVAEVCTGASPACPADGLVPVGTVCRAAAAACDVAEVCTGIGAACPADGLVAAGTVCRASAGACDLAEACTGTSAACPVDGLVAAGTVCRASAGACDVAETCTGSSTACPNDSFAPATTTCRAAVGACDLAEQCTGSNATCPADSLVATGTVCRASAGECDVAEECSGTSGACPTDGFKNPGAACSDDGNPCTTDTCGGSNALCQHPAGNAGVVCRAAMGTCDVAESCTGSSAACPADTLVASGTVCRGAAGACDVAETCSGTSASCPNNDFKQDGSTCGDGNPCSQTCTSGVCKGAPVNIDDGNPCTADSCDTTGGVSHVPLPAGTSCSGGAPCSTGNACDGHGACVPIDDKNSCTIDTCDPGNGVSHTPVAVGIPCANSASCPGAATCDASGTCAACIVGKIQLSYRGDVVTNAGSITIPSVLAGSKGVVVPLTVSNIGNGDLILSGTPDVAITGPNAADFSVQSFPATTLAVAGHDTIELRFAPLASGARTASLVITSNDSTSSPFVITLTATALSTSDLDPNTNGTWSAPTTALCNTREARLMARTGDIDNLGFGWPSGFDPFAGFNTPPHGFPWGVNPADAAGTDRISVGTSFTAGCRDGYCADTSRPANLPQCIAINLQAACYDGTLPNSAVIQMFVDDFQPRVWGSKFQVTLNGQRAPQIEDGINTLAQTGPIGELMSFTLTPDQLPLLQSGTVSVCIDDPTTGIGDGYAIDFVKLLVDAYGTDYKGTINGQVTAAVGGAPIAGATVSAGGVVTTTTDASGNYTLSNVPAGFVYLYASSPGFQTNGQIVDLPNAQTKTVNIAMVVNHAPVITSTPVTQVLVGQTYSYHVIATDADSDTLTYGVPEGAPPGMTFDEFTGQITWAPTADQVGTWSVTVEVNDRRGGVATQSFDIHVAAANKPPTVACQPDMHLIGSSANFTLSCTIGDDGQLEATPTPEWYFAYRGDQAPTLTPTVGGAAEIVLMAPGIYEFVLTANDGQYQASDSVIVTLSPTANPPLSVFAGADQGTTTLTTTLVGTALGGTPPLSMEWTQVDGPAMAQIADPTALSTGVIFDSIGTYEFKLTATDGLETDSDDVRIFVEPANGTAFTATQGWIGSPTHQATVTGQVPITLGAGQTLTTGTVTYWPATAPDQVHALATGLTGGPGTTLATLDTTTLSNGSYIIQLDATNNLGIEQVSAVQVTVSGDYKPGRVVVEVTDMTVPLTGIPITVGRRYDSLEKDTVGDFGHGWSLTLGHPKLEVDPSHNVTMTMPDGRRSTFYFQATSVTQSITFAWLYTPGYVTEPGTFGTLTSDGCSLVLPSGGQIVCFLDGSLDYAPTTYTYTDQYGRVFVMGADGSLKSITDRQQNVLTFSPTGITSNSGVGVTFARDGLGRIRSVTSPAVDSTTGPIIYQYAYDLDGNLQKVTQPDNYGTYQYTYADHRLVTTKDPNGHPARTSTYDDESGRLATDKDALGNTTTYAYDLPSHKTTITNPDLGTVVQTFDDRGLLLKEVDPLGRTTEHTYDDNRNELTRKNALNEVMTFKYDDNGNQTSSKNQRGEETTTTYNTFSQPLIINDPEGHTTTITYDDRGIPMRISDQLGTMATFTSSERGLPLTATDADGKTVYLAYDAGGNLTSRTDRLGRLTQYAYDGAGRLTQTTDPRGGITKYVHHFLGPVSKKVVPTGVPGAESFGWLYDDAGNLVSETSDEGRQTDYTYDELNHLTKVDHPRVGTTVEYTRDFRGNPLTMKDESQRITRYEYDKAGQLLKTTFPDQSYTSRTYDDLGRLKAATDERGSTTKYEYEPGCGCAERVTKVTDPIGRSTTTTYDKVGRRASETDAASHTTTYEYDLRGHLTKTIYADNTAELDGYDPQGRRTSHTDQMEDVTLYAYDAESQLTSITDALTHVTSYGYDDAGNLTSVTDANSHTTAYEYDHLNRKTKRTLPLGMSETFTHNMYGDVTGHADFRGKTTTQTFDFLGRLLTMVPDPTLGEATVSFTYNPTGTRASMADASGTTTYGYDSRDRLLTKATPAGTLTYTHDLAGNVETIRSSNANGTSVDYVWDAANQLVSVTDNRVGGVTTSAYTATGNPSILSHPSGVGAAYTYDARDRVTSLAWARGASPAFSTWASDFNDRGQRTGVTDATGRHVAYGYDAVARLVSETITNAPNGVLGNGRVDYTLDAAGNRLSRASTLASVGAQTFAYDANDQVTSDGFDANGNVTNSNGHSYSYDFESRVVSKDGGAVTVVYDGDGNRVAKTAGG